MAMKSCGGEIHGVHPYPGSSIDIALNLGMPCTLRKRHVVHPRLFGDPSHVQQVCGCVTFRTLSAISILIDLTGNETAPQQQSGCRDVQQAGRVAWQPVPGTVAAFGPGKR